MTADGIPASQRWLVSTDNYHKEAFNLPSRILSALEPRSKKLGLSWQHKKPPQNLSHELRPDAISGWLLVGQGYERQVMRQLVYVTPLDKVLLARESPSWGWGSTARWRHPGHRQEENGPAPLQATAHLCGKSWEKCKSSQKLKWGLRGRVWELPARRLHTAMGQMHMEPQGIPHLPQELNRRTSCLPNGRKEELENYHTKILSSGNENNITFIGCLSRKATHTLEASSFYWH